MSVYRGLIPESKLSPNELRLVLSEERKDAYISSLKDRLSSEARAIEVELTASSSPFEPLHPDRPYGLPLDWGVSGREQIWENILRFIDEPEDVFTVGKVSPLFKVLLKGKYKAARLAEVSELLYYDTPSFSTDAILGLRLVSRTAKKVIDHIFMNGRLTDDVERRLEFLVPTLELKINADLPLPQALDEIVSKLEDQNHHLPKGTFPLRKLTFDERDVLEVDLPHLRDQIQKLLEFVGDSFHALEYFTDQSSHDTYGLLCRWLGHLPNLEELTVGVTGHHEIQPFEPFPIVPGLQRFYEEDPGGFALPHLKEILRSNPTIKILKLSDDLGDYGNGERMDEIIAAKIFDDLHLHLEGFIFEQRSSNLQRFLDLRVPQWPLKYLELTNSSDSVGTKKLFGFMNQFRETLTVCKCLMSVFGNGGMMQLPKLTCLEWWLQNDQQPLGFLIPLKSLKYFDIHVPEESTRLRTDQGWEGTKKYLESFHVPQLFPAMKKMMATKHFSGEEMEAIWTR